MKFVCYKDTIIKALNSVVKGVASKTTMPILEGILIQTNEGEIKLTTYDLEIGIEYTMKCDIIEHGSTVVNAPPNTKYSIFSPGRVKLTFDTVSEQTSKLTLSVEFTNMP